MIGRLLAFLFGSCALIGLTANILASGESRHTRALLVGDVVLLVVAPLFLLIRRVRPWLVNASTATGTVLITLAVHLMGGGAAAVSGSMLYLLVVLPSFYLYPRPIAWAHGLLVGALSLVVLRHNAVLGPQEMVRGTGTALALAVVFSWLVGVGEETERDYVTGLTNRRGFERRAQLFLQEYDARERAVLVLIELDHLKAMSAYRGQDHRDALLLALGRAWTDVLPERSILARYGDEEFALLVDAVGLTAIDETLASMRTATLPLGFTAGIAWCAPGEPLAALMLRASAALLQAQRHDHADTVTAPEASSGHNGHELRAALRRGEFELHYQPIVSLETGMVEKAEALVRWIRPGQGTVPPDEFIRLAEQTGTMLDLGDWIVTTACRTAVTWPANPAGNAIGVSVNASGTELADPTYGDRVLRHLASSGLPPERLVIELVESDYSLVAPHVQANLATLVDAGVQLAVDDFGTGHSSLSRLDQLSVHILKIDRSFITTLGHPAQEMPVVSAILAMASALALDVVAEGVETAAQATWLRARGCSHAQGFHYSRPVPDLAGARLAHPRQDQSGHDHA